MCALTQHRGFRALLLVPLLGRLPCQKDAGAACSGCHNPDGLQMAETRRTHIWEVLLIPL